MPSSNNSGNGTLCGVRDYQFQILAPLPGSSDPTPQWQAVKTMTGNRAEWVLSAHFNTINAAAVRIVIHDVNNGYWYEDKTPLPVTYGNGYASYSSLDAVLYEIEAYGAN